MAETRAKTKQSYEQIKATFKDMQDDIQLLNGEILKRSRDEIRESDLYFSEPKISAPESTKNTLVREQSEIQKTVGAPLPVRPVSLIPSRRSLIPSRKQMVANAAAAQAALPTRTVINEPEHQSSRRRRSKDDSHRQSHSHHDDREQTDYRSGRSHDKYRDDRDRAGRDRDSHRIPTMTEESLQVRITSPQLPNVIECMTYCNMNIF